VSCIEYFVERNNLDKKRNQFPIFGLHCHCYCCKVWRIYVQCNKIVYFRITYWILWNLFSLCTVEGECQKFQHLECVEVISFHLYHSTCCSHWQLSEADSWQQVDKYWRNVTRIQLKTTNKAADDVAYLASTCVSVELLGDTRLLSPSRSQSACPATRCLLPVKQLGIMLLTQPHIQFVMIICKCNAVGH